jgi:hypothetical protein
MWASRICFNPYGKKLVQLGGNKPTITNLEKCVSPALVKIGG